MTIKNYLITQACDYHHLFEFLNINFDSKKIIFLKGNLGSGKTFLVKELLKYLYNFNNTSSPTFGIINSYLVEDKTIYHYDLYRINNSSELDEIGFYNNLEINTLHFIEWPEIIPRKIIKSNIDIYLEVINEQRLISVDIDD